VGSNCDISGTYTFDDALLCRDVNSTEEAGACPAGDVAATARVQYAIHIKETNLCAPEALDATKELTTTLTAYAEKELVTAADTFQTGDGIFWKFSLTNPQGTIDKIEFNQIRIENMDGGDADVLLEQTNYTAVGVAVSLDTTGVETITPAGQTVSLSFSYKLWRSALVNTVGTLTGDGVDADVAIRTVVVVDIWYHGNQKRSVDFEVTQASQAHSIRVINNGNEEPSQQIGQQLSNLLNSSASSSFVGSFALFVLSMAYLLM